MLELLLIVLEWRVCFGCKFLINDFRRFIYVFLFVCMVFKDVRDGFLGCLFVYGFLIWVKRFIGNGFSLEEKELIIEIV